MDVYLTRWDVLYGKPFKIGKPRAEEILANGEARFRSDGALDMRFRNSRFVARYFPDARNPAISPANRDRTSRRVSRGAPANGNG